MIEDKSVAYAAEMAPRAMHWNTDDLRPNGGSARLVDDLTGITMASVCYQLVAGAPAFWQAYANLGIDRIGEFPADTMGPGYAMLCVDIRVIEELALRRGESVCGYGDDHRGEHDHSECQSALLDLECEAKARRVGNVLEHR